MRPNRSLPLVALFIVLTAGLWPLSLFPGEASNSIIGGPIVNPANAHTYYLLAPATWTDAEAEAVSLGGHLVTINDAAEETWVWDTFSQFGGVDRTIWIGMTDAASEGNWVWISGEPVTFTYWAQVTNEPNNCGGNENYGHIFPPWEYRAPFWNDILNSGEGGCGGGFAVNGVVEVLTAPVGGIAELPEAAEGGSSSATYLALAGGLAAAVVALRLGVWYARRRWGR